MTGEPWDGKLFQRHRDDDPDESCPAERFRLQCTDSVATDLIAVVDAVAESLPGVPREGLHPRAGTGAPAQPPLYPLPLPTPRAAPAPDRAKAVGTAFTEADYALVRRLSDEYRRRVSRNVV